MVPHVGAMGKQGVCLIGWSGNIFLDVYLVCGMIGCMFLWAIVMRSGVGWKGKRRL